MTTLLDKPRTIAPPEAQRAAASSIAPSGIGAALVVCGSIFGFDRWSDPYYIATSVAAVLALGLLLRPISVRGLRRRAMLAALQSLAAILVLFTGDRAIAAWEEHAPRFGAASSLASVALNLVGYRTASERGLLFIEHPEGLVTMVPSLEKLGLRAFLLFWLAWVILRLVRGHRSVVVSSIVGLGTILAVALLRYVVLLAVYIEHDNILVAGAGQAALDLFTSPWITGFFLLLAGFAGDRACRFVPQAPASTARARPSVRKSLACAATIALLAAAMGFAWSFSPAGKQKPGRILIDDRFCGIWEPTARQLDTEWYGDFPTYSFTSLAEWLGKWYSVDANTTRPYDDELLSHYDVLIIKTPEEPIPDTETAAIERFVRRGGGLLLVGDHTNLLGMGTHLNAMSAKHGIQFRYDSVSDALTGGFVDCTPPTIGRHLGALHVEKLQFMTSCSLQLSGGAQTVLAADNCRREPHDYAGSSFFGRRGPHPEMEHGRTVLAGIVNVGRGRIAAFTDSTVWSSFAVFSHDREKLAMDLIRVLNREQSPWEKPIRCAAVAVLLATLLMGGWMVRCELTGFSRFRDAQAVGFGPCSSTGEASATQHPCSSTGEASATQHPYFSTGEASATQNGLQFVQGYLALAAVIFGLAGFWVGAGGAEALHRAIYAWPEPSAPISEVTFLWQGGACAFPPVLGSPGNLAADRCFDTLLVSVQRLGLVPRVAYTFDKDFLTPNTRAMFVIAPVNPPPAKAMSRLHDFVRRGGCLIVLDDSRIGERGSAKDFLRLFDATITYHGALSHDGSQRPHVHLGGGMTPVKVPAADAFVARKGYEQGQVVYMPDAADFSRQGLGHCFARPWKTARARYDTIFMLLRDVLRIAPGDRRFYGVL